MANGVANALENSFSFRIVIPTGVEYQDEERVNHKRK